MKRILLVLTTATLFVACKTEDKKVKDSPLNPVQKEEVLKDSSNFTSITWLDSTSINLGKVKKGAEVEVVFRFRNTGSKQLVITNVQPQCGCTVTEKPEKPFAPGEEGTIKGKFNSANQPVGEHRKSIAVTSNTLPNYTNLEFRVEVIE